MLSNVTTAVKRVGAVAFVSLLAAGQVHATDATLADSGFAVGVGGFAAVTPKYEGSSSYRVIGAPILFPAFGRDGPIGGRLQFNGPDDLRFRLIEFGGFEAGPLVGWRFGRDEDDGARLRGLGDVDGGFVAGGYLAYRVGFLKPFLSYHHQLTGDTTGGVLRFGAEAKSELARGIETTATVGASYASADYMDAYFSISSAQAATSVAGLQRYEAGAGIKDVYLGLAASIPVADFWTLRLSGRYTHLIGDAADSPLVESESQWMGTVGLTYRWQLR